jgi:hypothetical protein
MNEKASPSTRIASLDTEYCHGTDDMKNAIEWIKQD